jgi:hypothetical protein
VQDLLQEARTPDTHALEHFRNFESLLGIPMSYEDTQDKFYERMTLMLRFVKGYYDFKYWGTMEVSKRFEHLQMDQMNLFQWIVFYDDHLLLEHIMTKTPVGEKLLLISALQGDH